ncbi:hypothetical protein AB0K60_05525 [Thermopolyspora sp. NPDC052614]
MTERAGRVRRDVRAVAIGRFAHPRAASAQTFPEAEVPLEVDP